jgi:hypothetical protein
MSLLFLKMKNMKNKVFFSGKVLLGLLLISSGIVSADPQAPTALSNSQQPPLLGVSNAPSAATQPPAGLTPSALPGSNAPLSAQAIPAGINLAPAGNMEGSTPDMSAIGNTNTAAAAEPSFQEMSMPEEHPVPPPSNPSLSDLAGTLDKVVRYLAQKDPTFTTTSESGAPASETSVGKEAGLDSSASSGREIPAPQGDLPPAPLPSSPEAPNNSVPVQPPVNNGQAATNGSVLAPQTPTAPAVK